MNKRGNGTNVLVAPLLLQLPSCYRTCKCLLVSLQSPLKKALCRGYSPASFYVCSWVRSERTHFMQRCGLDSNERFGWPIHGRWRS